MPPVILLNPVLAYESGDDFMRAWWRAARGELDPFILVLEGSVPNEEINGDGHWAGLGVDPETGQPILTNTWIDRLAPRAAAVLALGTCAAYGGIPAMRNNPTGAMGLSDYLGRRWVSRRGLPIVNLPGCPVQPDNITETLLYLVLHIARMAARARARRAGPAAPDLRSHRARGLRPRRARRGGAVLARRTATDAAWSSSAARARSSSATCRSAAGSTGSAGVPTWAGSAWRARCPGSPTSTCRSVSPMPRHGCTREPRGSRTDPSSGTCGQRRIRRTYDVEPAWRKRGAALTTGYGR